MHLFRNYTIKMAKRDSDVAIAVYRWARNQVFLTVRNTITLMTMMFAVGLVGLTQITT